MKPYTSMGYLTDPIRGCILLPGMKYSNLKKEEQP